jgi:pilus assembly protein CpaD
VNRGIIRKDAKMRSKLLLIALCSAVTACNTPDLADKGLASVHVPVVTSADYAFDASAPGGVLAPGEPQRLDGWFQGLGLGYGDMIYVDARYGESARDQVAAVASRYGMLVSEGAPITAGALQGDSVRVVVSRRRAEVPGCPDWSIPSQPNFDNRNMPNFGCGVNSNLAMQVANPVDLLRGQTGASAVDATTGAKAIIMYRNWPLTGTQPGQQLRQLTAPKSTTEGDK